MAPNSHHRYMFGLTSRNACHSVLRLRWLRTVAGYSDPEMNNLNREDPLATVILRMMPDCAAFLVSTLIREARRIIPRNHPVRSGPSGVFFSERISS